MTHKRLTPEREAEIRNTPNTDLNWGHVGELLAEIDALREHLSLSGHQNNSLIKVLESNDWLAARDYEALNRVKA